MDAEAVVGEQACAVDFLMEAGTTMIAGVTCGKRTALQSQTQRAAMDDAVRCDERCTALRHFTQTIPMRQEGPSNRPHSRPSACKDHVSPTRPCHRNPASCPTEAPVEPASQDRLTDCQKEYKEPKNRTERAKRPNEERCATERSGP